MLLGKRLYKTTAIGTIKLLSVVVSIVLFLNLYFQTFNDPVFLSKNLSTIREVFSFHLFYPEELITYILFLFCPTMYYGFVRGTSFHENGIVINKGLPFFNTFILYKDISHYEVIHSKYLMAIHHRLSDDDILFSVNSIDRVVAILDQQGIQGDLGGKIKADFYAHKKLIMFFIFSSLIVGFLQYSGLVRSLFR